MSPARGAAGHPAAPPLNFAGVYGLVDRVEDAGSCWLTAEDHSRRRLPLERGPLGELYPIFRDARAFRAP